MMNWDNIKKIFRILKNTDISEFEYEKDGEKIKVKRGSVHSSEVPEGHPHGRQEIQKKSAGGDSVPEEDEQRLFTVTSPIVGTFYSAPSPDDPPFVETGTAVGKGQVLCIIEAMKLMNEIESEVDGVVTRILVENSQPVEYGEPLFLIDPK